MKVKFSRSINFVPAWNGNKELPEAEQIKVVIKPLEINDLFAMLDAMGGQEALSGAQSSGKLSLNAKMVGECAGILTKYVELTGLEDDDGPVSVQDLTRYPSYMELAVELIMAAAELSMPSEKAKGN